MRLVQRHFALCVWKGVGGCVCVCVCGQLLELAVRVTGETLMSLCAAVLDDLPLCPLSDYHSQPKHIGDMKSLSETQECL